MKSKLVDSVVTIRYFAFIAAILILSGCVSHGKISLGKYNYDNIKKEYASALCRLKNTDKENPDKQICELRKAISLEEAISAAFLNNPDNMMAAARIKQAQAMIDQADSVFHPSIGFYTEYTKGDAPSVYLFRKIDQRKLPGQTDFNDPGAIENFESGINARINLYNGGRDLLNKKIAKTNLSISIQDQKSVENALVASVIRAYYNTLAATEYIKIARESISTVNSQLRVMKIRYEGGSVLKSDILSLKVRLATAKEELLRSRNRQKMSNAALARILGIDPNREIKLKRPKAKALHYPIPEKYMDGVEYGLKNRPEIKTAEERVKQAKMALDMAVAGYLPKVDINARYYMDDESAAYETERQNWMVGLAFNWELYTGLSTPAMIKKALGQLEESLAADRKTRLSIKLDIKNVYLNLSEAQARFEVAKSSVEMAEESLDLVKKQYEGGSSAITRYLEAELDRNRSRMRYTNAFYDRQKAMADAGRAMGYWLGKNKKNQDL
ncbi:TolC family protein [Desulfobacterales bacterium HSG16]|nr:TolC family protein [Desulfobacterales bacterium HSG16]